MINMNDRPSEGTKRTLSLLLMLVILMVAYGVRVHNLGTQSLWYDEGVAYRHSLRTLPELVSALQNNVHVPGYFGLLGLWEDVTGASEFALRYLSVLFSILSVVFTYALGKRLYHPIAGLAAAAFVALNTFSIYYAQETRMYAMLAAVAVASMWAYVAFMRQISHSNHQAVPMYRDRRFQYGLALGLLNAVGMYTHYSYPLLMIAQGFLTLLWLGGMAYKAVKYKDSLSPAVRALIYYTLANLLTILLFLPWLPTAISSVTAQPNISETIDTALVIRMIEGWWAFGNTFELHMGTMGVAVYFFLLFGMLIFPAQARQNRAWWRTLLPVVWVLVAAALYLLLELTSRYMRFLLPAQAGFALWVGRGVWVLWTLKTRQTIPAAKYVPKFTALFATAVMLMTMAGGLTYLYNNPEFQRDNYRQLAADIEANLREGDAVILDAPGLMEIFGYYYEGDAPLYPLPQSRDDIQTLADTREVIAAHNRVFALMWGMDEQDPNHIVETTLNNEAYQVSDEWYGTVRLVRYVTPQTLEDVQASGAQFGEHITLESYALSSDTVQPGDVVQIQLDWSTDESLDTRYKVFVQLLNADYALAAQRDSEPGGGQAITTTWQPGETIHDRHALLISDGLPAGSYILIIGLYDLNDASARLLVNDGDFLVLDTIRVE